LLPLEVVDFGLPVRDFMGSCKSAYRCFHLLGWNRFKKVSSQQPLTRMTRRPRRAVGDLKRASSSGVSLRQELQLSCSSRFKGLCTFFFFSLFEHSSEEEGMDRSSCQVFGFCPLKGYQD